QPQWTLLAPGGSPPIASFANSVIFDPVGNRLICFGGVGNGFQNEVRALTLDDAPTWTLLTPAGTPPPGNANACAIYDPDGQRMIVFGGFAPNPSNDTWALSLGATPTWTHFSFDGPLPPPR